MTKKLEIEKKFLIKPPKSWIDFSNIIENLIDIKRISQTYLKPEPGEQAARVRKTVEGLTNDTDIVYHYNKKKPTKDTGTHEETEYEISKIKYEAALKKANTEKCAVEKTRFVFEYHDQVFELDVFKGHLKGLAILEIELKDKDQVVELPPFLDVIKEVTKNKEFSNFHLADKKLKENASRH